MKKKYHQPIIDHPWMVNVTAHRPGGYKTVDVLDTDDLMRMAGRLNTLAIKLRVMFERLKSYEAEELDVIGLNKLQENLQGMERGVNVFGDCLDQWIAHEHPADIEPARTAQYPSKSAPITG